MRTILTTLLAALMIHTLPAQVTLDVLDPPILIGTYAHSWAEPAEGSWSTPDMLDPANRVVGQLVLALDGTSADSLTCSVLVDPVNMNGEIALLYRGTCDYSVKAKHCQDAGAIAVLLINNLAGQPPDMGA